MRLAPSIYYHDDVIKRIENGGKVETERVSQSTLIRRVCIIRLCIRISLWGHNGGENDTRNERGRR